MPGQHSTGIAVFSLPKQFKCFFVAPVVKYSHKEGKSMGLFKKKEVHEPPEPEKNPEAKIGTKWESVWTNLTDKMLRVELEGDKATAGILTLRRRMTGSSL